MIDYEGFRKPGRFTLDTGVEVQGELILKGSATSLSLHTDVPFKLHDNSDISGVFYDGRKVSLIKCIGIVNSGKSCSFANIFPHFVLFSKGKEHIHVRYTDQIIDKISFTVDDAHMLFYDTSTFGSILVDTRAKLERLLDGEEPKREIELGSNPKIFYCTDKVEIISVDTAFGKVSANNDTSEKLSINKGIHIDNTIKIDIEFKRKVNIGEAIGTVYDLLRFIEILAGRPKNISQITCSSVEPGYKYFDFYVYLCNYKHHEIDTRFSGWPPIEAVHNPDEFSGVLKYWAEQHEKRRHARVRFSEAFSHQNKYTIDRLIGAANMFDLLPASIYQGAVKRQKSIVLKDKVKHRSKLITDKVGKHFPKIALVIDKAVDLRNYYVHGTKKNNINYSKISGQVMFFTDTLEFIFAASELVEAGWDIAAWIKEKFPSEHHPFRTYHLSYRERLDSLNKLLAEKV
uniref:ApeA N-terminal domain 1-containing protein n=1 Tax=Candidatus Electronema sp. TaxID=2698783 RepID=UPI0040563299